MKAHYFQILICIMLFGIGCNEKKVGETIIKVSTENSEIFIDKFPHGRAGIEGLATISYPEGFSIQEIDEAIYDFTINKAFSQNIINLKLRHIGKDQYGKDTLGKVLVMGKINVLESKKYADYHSWKAFFGLERLFAKYKSEVDSTRMRIEIKEDIMSQLSQSSTESKNSSVKETNALDQDRGFGELKLGLSMSEVKSFAEISLSDDDGGESYKVDNLSNFTLFGSQLYTIRLFFDKDILVELRAQLMPYDVSDTEIAEDQERIIYAYQNLYGQWSRMPIDEHLKSFGIVSYHLIKGNTVQLTRYSIDVIKEDDGGLIKPGDLYSYKDLLTVNY